MKLIIDINEKDYNSIISDKLISPRNLNVYERIIANGIPLEDIKVDIADKIIDYRYNNEVTIDDVLAILDGENKE